MESPDRTGSAGGPNGSTWVRREPTPSAVGFVDPDVMAAIVGATVEATATDGALTDAQTLVVQAVASMLVGHEMPTADCPPVAPDRLAAVADQHGLTGSMRIAIVKYQALSALLLDPVPPATIRRIEETASALGVDQTLAAASLRPVDDGFADAALLDFARNGYARSFFASGEAAALHADVDPSDGWRTDDHDRNLAERWQRLGELAHGTLGRGVWDFYRSRAFTFPGTPDSASPLLAQHDWIHVLADYGTRLESELEVFAMIAESDDDPHGFSLLAMVIGLFETGAVPSAAGIFEADTGHLDTPGMPERLADALRRGSLVTKPDGSRDGGLLATDWFAHAHRPIDEVREACGIVAKAPAAIMAGSAGTWDVAGLSDFQVAHCDLTILDSYHHPHTPEAPQVDNDDIDPTVPPSGTGCVECDRTGGWWVHLRRCAACGHIGCCDTSPSQHASHHAQDTGHPVIQSFEPGEDWFYDYRSGDFVDGPTLAPPTSHPADQAVPGPADRVPPDWRSLIH